MRARGASEQTREVRKVAVEAAWLRIGVEPRPRGAQGALVELTTALPRADGARDVGVREEAHRDDELAGVVVAPSAVRVEEAAFGVEEAAVAEG